MFADFTVDAAPMVTKILHRNIKVLIYNGDKDYICNWEGTDIWVNNLEWKYKEEFKYKSMVDIDGGKRKSHENFIWHVIHEAGHMVPMD